MKQHIIAHIIAHVWKPLFISVLMKKVRCAIEIYKSLCGDVLSKISCKFISYTFGCSYKIIWLSARWSINIPVYSMFKCRYIRHRCYHAWVCCRADVLQMYGDWIYNKIRWDSSEGIYFLCRGTCLKVGCSLSLRGPCSSFGCRILPSIFHSSYQHRNSPNSFISSFIFILIRQRYHLILDRIIYHLYIADSHIKLYFEEEK